MTNTSETGAVQIFDNPDFGKIRVIMIDNEPWFVGKDVAIALGYKDTINALKQHVDTEDKLRWKITTSGQRREVTIINESGSYSLILSSKLETAKQFKRWVTSEVLPSVRKHGAYLTQEVMQKTLQDPDYIIGIITALKEEQIKRRELEKTQTLLMHSDKTYTTVELAKELNLKSAQELNNKLNQMGILYKKNGVWLLYSKYANKGYMEIKQKILQNSSNVIYYAHWTNEGRKFILELFEKEKEKEKQFLEENVFLEK